MHIHKYVYIYIYIFLLTNFNCCLFDFCVFQDNRVKQIFLQKKKKFIYKYIFIKTKLTIKTHSLQPIKFAICHCRKYPSGCFNCHSLLLLKLLTFCFHKYFLLCGFCFLFCFIYCLCFLLLFVALACCCFVACLLVGLRPACTLAQMGRVKLAGNRPFSVVPSFCPISQPSSCKFVIKNLTLNKVIEHLWRIQKIEHINGWWIWERFNCGYILGEIIKITSKKKI